ncbi:thioredoxin family protein [Luteolibacter arcticus]|uniref:Thioredoxin family protein n=1 Tax=Luteolibacter arcticus TaxID=1581411 RepID=A0ABT3GFR4_9BACT|nr:thioredoxin family protein [Luteolibacter arcticus]MCW1922463.1 thioredoxin family protein [Luteolibacter arcticus]
MTRILSIFACLLLPLSAATWTSDFDAALKEAKASEKAVLIDFTGSDWCAWCIKLRQEVFDQPEFEAGAKDKFIFVELDYPKDKSRVTEAVGKQNAELLKRYPIKGYPTILLCDGEGRPFAATAYQEGGPGKYLPHLDELLAKRTARDKAFAEADKKEGVEKAKLLIAALEGLQLDPPIVAVNYPQVAEQIKKADPNDETGFAKNQAAEGRFADFMAKLGESRQSKNLDGEIKAAEAALADPKITGELRQQVYGHHAASFAYAEKFDEAIVVLNRAIADEPDGTRTVELQNFRSLLERLKAGLPAEALPSKGE